MKKILAAILSLTMVLALTACGEKQSEAPAASNGEFKFDETITLVVPFTAGGAGDVAVRTLQPYLEKQLGVSIVVDNPDGAGGTIGTSQYVADGADPYKILLEAPTSIVFRPLTNGTDYSYAENLTAIAQMTAAPLCLVVRDDYEIQDAEALLADMKANPGKYSYANSGNGSISDIAFSRLLNAAGIEAKAVPFSGTAEQYTAIMGDHVDLGCMSITEAASKEGIHAIINLGTNTGDEIMAGIPTCADLGYEGCVTDTAFGLLYHKEVDPAIVAMVDTAVKAAMEDPECVAAFAEAGLIRYYRNATDFDQFLTDFIADTTTSLDAMGLLVK